VNFVPFVVNNPVGANDSAESLGIEQCGELTAEPLRDEMLAEDCHSPTILKSSIVNCQSSIITWRSYEDKV